MSKYDLPSKTFAGLEEKGLDAETIDGLWELFLAICGRWQNTRDPLSMRSRLLGFLSNRIELHPEYVSHYRSALTAIADLRREHGERAYEELFTSAKASNAPPQTPLQIARQLVSNEFIALQLSLGGFKEFTGAINYPGYIAGWNGDGPAPYRVYEPKK